MEVTIKQRTWTPFTYMSEESINREGYEISRMVDDINVDFNTLEYMIESIADGSNVYTEATEGVITKLGRKIADTFRRLVRWVNNVLGSTKMEDMNNVEKMEAISKKYPLIKDRIMVYAQEGLLDVSAIKDMNDFIEQYSRLDRWADAKELTKTQKLIADGKKVLNHLDDNVSGINKGLRTCTDFIKNTEAFKDEATKLMKNISKTNPDELENACNTLDKMTGRDNAQQYNSTAKPGDYQEATLQDLSESDIAQMLRQALNSLINVLNSIVAWVVKKLSNVKKSRAIVAGVIVGVGRMMVKYGTIDNIIEAHKQGRVKLPNYVSVKGDKFVVDPEKATAD